MAKLYWADIRAKDKSFIEEIPTLQPEGAGELSGDHFDAPLEEVADLLRVIDAWEGRAVVAAYHRPTASWIFIALHEVLHGASVGGCRIKSYPAPVEGLRDAMRLAEGMTHKWALIGADSGGGGKAVLALTKSLSEAERTELLLSFADILEELDGAFGTGVDFGMTSSDLITLAQASKHVHGFDRATGQIIESGFYTALGVAACLRPSLARVFSAESLKGRTVLVQGVGQVGSHLARMLAADGARVLISDIRPELAGRLAVELGCEVIPGEEVYTTDCDVYAPCALGGTLNEQTAALLECRIVAGAANNQLQNAAIADHLHRRHILYAPDYVINAGGAIALTLLHQGTPEKEARLRVHGSALTLAQILDEAASHNESPLHAAERRVAHARSRTHASAANETELKFV